jgi:RNA polymerase sigma-70 factor, ECF subfamily
MLGSLQDAEDQVQETFLRAWRGLKTYQGRASFRAWLYKIATNACLDAVNRVPRRSLPDELYPPADPSLPVPAPILEPVWVQPYPDEWIAPSESSPEARFSTRESVSLAFTVALQVLSPRQRCALILGDVLDWSAAEIAHALESTLPAINSLLYRARITLKKHYTVEKQSGLEKSFDQETKNLLDQYLRAWETADIDTIIALLTEDARFPMPPLPAWYQGRTAIRSFITGSILAGDAKRRWRLLPFQANCQPGFAFYLFDVSTGRYLAYALQILEIHHDQVAKAITFGYPNLFARFNLPGEISNS